LQYQKLQQVFKISYFGLDEGRQQFLRIFYCRLMLFEVIRDVQCSGLSSCYCCYAAWESTIKYDLAAFRFLCLQFWLSHNHNVRMMMMMMMMTMTTRMRIWWMMKMN